MLLYLLMSLMFTEPVPQNSPCVDRIPEGNLKKAIIAIEKSTILGNDQTIYAPLAGLILHKPLRDAYLGACTQLAQLEQRLNPPPSSHEELLGIYQRNYQVRRDFYALLEEYQKTLKETFDAQERLAKQREGERHQGEEAYALAIVKIQNARALFLEEQFQLPEDFWPEALPEEAKVSLQGTIRAIAKTKRLSSRKKHHKRLIETLKYMSKVYSQGMVELGAEESTLNATQVDSLFLLTLDSLNKNQRSNLIYEKSYL